MNWVKKYWRYWWLPWAVVYLASGIVVIFTLPSGTARDILVMRIQMLWLMPMIIYAMWLVWPRRTHGKDH